VAFHKVAQTIKNRWREKRERVVLMGRRTVVSILYVLGVLTPLVGLTYLPRGVVEIDPEIVNGLLAGSSIVFGFAMFLQSRTTSTIVTYTFFSFDLILLTFCATTLFLSALESWPWRLFSLIVSASSFNANIVTAGYLLRTT